jgi:hypothetical protein
MVGRSVLVPSDDTRARIELGQVHDFAPFRAGHDSHHRFLANSWLPLEQSRWASKGKGARWHWLPVDAALRVLAKRKSAGC